MSVDAPKRLLVVGLGNPGTEYEWTRHNLGFMLVDLLARQANADIRSSECKALVGRARIENANVELVKPQTYMNLSGESIACLLRKRAELTAQDNLLVVIDDLALPFGSIRLRASGSSGGHNGLKSIKQHLRTEDYPRLRIGIKPEHPVADTARFVLERFPHGARRNVEEVLERSAEVVRAVITDGIEHAMARYN